MPTGIYKRSIELKLKMKLSHMKGWTSSYKKVKSHYTNTGIPTDISQAMKGWTKWGGPRQGYSSEEENNEWYCQSCKEKQTDELPAYLISVDRKDWARICSVCFYESLINDINNIFDLIDFVR
jgi:hypothetical protein